MTLDESKHLLNRTSFGYTQNDLNLFTTLTKKEAVEYLFSNVGKHPTISLPSDIQKVSLRPKKFKTLSREQRKKHRITKQKKMKQLQIWWYKMMTNSKYSFQEKMVLFWHNHFVSEYRVVKNPYFMMEQNRLFRQHAIGDFSVLLHDSCKDLAMLIYLDNNSNKKTSPNENFARELMELFTLGEGNYSEDDVKNAARAFTGWRVNRKKALFKKVKKHHDYGSKIFLNQKGNFDGEDIVDILLEQKQTANFIVEKLHAEFISQRPNKVLIEKIANTFRESNYDIKAVVKDILLSDDFWHSNNSLIKSPTELIVGTIKNLNMVLEEKHYKFVLRTAKNLGQILFNPPNVKGWEGGQSWIDSSSYVGRQEFIRRVVQKNKSKKRVLKTYLLAQYQLK
ncbi:MAG: DUF1800 domain-containing protein [Campylobacterota bacterium]|nr:DUF1800 domain-containing protein [Campylobacterota bacterium]